MVLAGRKILAAVFSTRATGIATITGTGETLCAFSLALGTEQIEQECRGVFALSGCEWTACTVPIANTSNTQSTEMALTITPRFAQILCIAISVVWLR